MCTNNKISVVLTSYNHEKYLREAIDSVLNQTFSDFDFIIIDDASTDNSWEIINSYSDKRIRAFKNTVNTKGDFLRTAVSEFSLGEYIAVHHSDDIWEVNKLELQLKFLEAHPNIAAVFSNALIIGELGEPLEDKTHPYYSIFEQGNRSRHDWLNRFFYIGNALCHPSVLIRKTCFAEANYYRHGLSQLNDLDVWIRLCLKYDIHVLPEKLVRFRIRSNEMNISGNRPDTRIRSTFEMLEILNNYKGISSAEDFLKIFPTAQKYLSPLGMDTDYALAMIALEHNNKDIFPLFALNLLFEALNEPEKAKKLENLHSFTNSDFIHLSAQYDVFSLELLNTLREEISEKNLLIKEREHSQNLELITKDQQINLLNDKLNELAQISEQSQQKLERITNSKSWKIIFSLRKIILRLLPILNKGH